MNSSLSTPRVMAVRARVIAASLLLLAGVAPASATEEVGQPSRPPVEQLVPPASNGLGVPASVGERAAPTLAGKPASSTVAAVSGKPNIVLFMTDDQAVELNQYMPTVLAKIRDKGISFERAYYNYPLCCPSRATILTGRYAQNTGVTDQRYTLFLNGGNEPKTIAVWLHDAGYNTALIGKYLNGYPASKGISHVPPGWTFWAARAGTASAGEEQDSLYYNFRLSLNGKEEKHGTAPTDYSTDVYKGHALSFLDTALASDAPFFLYFSPSAPHAPHTPAPRHTGLYPGLTGPKDASYNEKDVSDKPAYIRAKPLLTSSEIKTTDKNYANSARALKAFDEAVAAIIGKIELAGRLDNTYLVFISDNGWVRGQHRLRTKGFPHEPVILMPLFISGPGIPAGSKSQSLVGNVDLAPTFAAWAGVTVPTEIDGRSIASLTSSRVAYPITNKRKSPSFIGIRTDRYTYVKYSSGEEELYDNVTDPLQLQSGDKLEANKALKANLADRAIKLSTCHGPACQQLEDSPL